MFPHFGFGVAIAVPTTERKVNKVARIRSLHRQTQCTQKGWAIIARARQERKNQLLGCFVDRAAADGLRVREYAPPAGDSVQCTVTAEDDILIGRLAADLNAAKRVDLCICDDRGEERIRLADIPFHSAAASVAFQQPITCAKAAPSETMIARLVALDDSGREHLLGECTFNHTRTLPGPGAW